MINVNSINNIPTVAFLFSEKHQQPATHRQLPPASTSNGKGSYHVRERGRQ